MNVAVQNYQWGVNVLPGYNAFLIRKRDFVSAGIRWFSHWNDIPNLPSPSHAFIITGEDETIEAFSDGVHYGNVSGYLNDPDCALLVRRPKGWTPDLGRSIVTSGQKHLGEKYGFALIGAMAVTNTFLGHGIDLLCRGGFSRWLDGLASTKRTDICSEVVAKADNEQPALHGQGILAEPADTIKPVDLFRDPIIFEPSGYAIEVVP